MVVDLYKIFILKLSKKKNQFRNVNNQKQVSDLLSHQFDTNFYTHFYPK